MKSIFTVIIVSFINVHNICYSQGLSEFEGTPIIAIIFESPTRIGSMDGPLAGTNILAQLMVGLVTDSMEPVGDPVSHRLDSRDGSLTGGARIQTVIPFIPDGSTGGFAQVAVWDRKSWGMEFARVPSSQFGYTEIREFPRSTTSGGAPGPMVSFEQSAIVPAIPEPNTTLIIITGGVIVLVRCRKSKIRNG